MGITNLVGASECLGCDLTDRTAAPTAKKIWYNSKYKMIIKNHWLPFCFFKNSEFIYFFHLSTSCSSAKTTTVRKRCNKSKLNWPCIPNIGTNLQHTKLSPSKSAQTDGKTPLVNIHLPITNELSLQPHRKPWSCDLPIHYCLFCLDCFYLCGVVFITCLGGLRRGIIAWFYKLTRIYVQLPNQKGSEGIINRCCSINIDN